MQFADFLWKDRAAPAAKDPDMAAAVFIQEVLNVFEKFQVSALVGCDGYPMGILFNGAFHDVSHGPVMTQVNDFGPLGLQDPAHDVDGGIMSVKETGSRYDPDFLCCGIMHKWQALEDGDKFIVKN